MFNSHIHVFLQVTVLDIDKYQYCQCQKETTGKQNTSFTLGVYCSSNAFI